MKLNEKKRWIIAIVAGVFTLVMVVYFGGVFGQIFTNYSEWLNADGILGQTRIKPVNWNPLVSIPYAFTANGLKGMLLIVVVSGIIFGVYTLYNRFGSKDRDPRGFGKVKEGTYGTASMMTDKELKENLELSTPENAEGVILGELNGKTVCMPKDTNLNRHIAIFGASGTMKSRAIIRNALFQALKNEESVVITDPKGELYADTAELYRQNGYEVKVFNLVNLEHSDSWNCMDDLGKDTLMSQLLASVIIGNTSSGKGDHFWDNGEQNLLKALVLYVKDKKELPRSKRNLSEVYASFTTRSIEDTGKLIDSLPECNAAKQPYNLCTQASDTVKAGILLGLGTRLQVLQNKEVQAITSRSDIDLAAPGQRKCAYYVIISDQDTTLAFLSSLFFSFLFIKLTRYADSQEDRKCKVPVNLILDEFNNIGRIGGAADGSDFARMLSTCRSRDIRVMLAVQSLGQLQNRYADNLWAEIIGNCDIQLMLGCTDEVSAKYFSNRSGEMSVEVSNTMTTRRTIALVQMIPQYRQMDGQGKRKLLTPDEVLRLPNTQMLCIVRGCNVLILNKMDYTKHPYAKRIVPASIMDYMPSVPMEVVEELPQETNKKKETTRKRTHDKAIYVDTPLDSI